MENIIDIRSIFKSALEQTISNYAEKARLEISQFILHICGEVRPYMVVTNPGAETLADEIFTNELRRDFIFNLLFNFCPRLSFTETKKEFSKLIQTFSFTLAIGDKVSQEGVPDYQNNSPSFNKLPDELFRRLPTRETITGLLEANKWLMIVLLISLYVSVEDFSSLELPSKSN